MLWLAKNHKKWIIRIIDDFITIVNIEYWEIWPARFRLTNQFVLHFIHEWWSAGSMYAWYVLDGLKPRARKGILEGSCWTNQLRWRVNQKPFRSHQFELSRVDKACWDWWSTSPANPFIIFFWLTVVWWTKTLSVHQKVSTRTWDINGPRNFELIPIWVVFFFFWMQKSR